MDKSYLINTTINTSTIETNRKVAKILVLKVELSNKCTLKGL